MSYQEVSQEQFSNEITRWTGQGVYPLEVITLTEHFNDYLPTIKKFDPASPEEVLLVLGGSYPTRLAALTVIAELWDKSEESLGECVDRTLEEMNNES